MSRVTATADRNLGGLFAAHVGSDRLAYLDLTVDPHAPRSVTYDELDERCGRVAAGLERRGLDAGARVAVLADNSVDYTALYLGIVRRGLVVVPLNTRVPAETLRFVCEDAGVRIVVHDAAHATMVPDGYDRVEIGSEAWDELLSSPPAPVADVDPGDVAVQMYTSGSTGRPKGVLLSHRSQLFTVSQYTAGGFFMDRGERILVSAPMYHKNAMVQTKVCLAMGGEIVLLARFGARSYLQAVADHGVTSLTGVPTMFALMTAERDLMAELDLTAVRRMMIGSAPMTEAFFEQVRELFPDATVTNGYGTTEVIAVFGGHPLNLPRPNITLGHPLATVDVRLVDPAGGEVTFESLRGEVTVARTAPAEAEGELWVRGPGTLNGYHGLPAVTAERLTDGWYHTGDTMRRDSDGWFFFVGRVDDMFVCGGENVYPGAVEHTLERHPAIHQAAVVCVPDAVKGALPVAFVVPEPGHTVSEADVKEWALTHGPAYQHPRAVWVLEEIPLAGTAKIDKLALAAQARRRFTPRP